MMTQYPAYPALVRCILDQWIRKKPLFLAITSGGFITLAMILKLLTHKPKCEFYIKEIL